MTAAELKLDMDVIPLIMNGGTGFKKLHYAIVDEAQDYLPETIALVCKSYLEVDRLYNVLQKKGLEVM